jgi:alkylated DNA repair protein (DNA oxidative demethylase)
MQEQLSLDIGPPPPQEPSVLTLGPRALLLRAFALPLAGALAQGIDLVLKSAPLRQMSTPGGRMMSVAMSNCGPLGWVSDRRGYRYSPQDPDTAQPWPDMPEPFLELARTAAAQAGFENFAPDACLINRYQVGARMGLHQDKDEDDFREPIVSVSLGLPATFLWGGDKRTDRAARVPLAHGDVVVWGGPSRLVFHGILPLRADHHPTHGDARFNLTFRRARGPGP